MKTADGIKFADLDAGRAIAACRDAIREYGAEPRFQYQLGRAYDKGGNFSQAIASFRKAAGRGYAPAQYQLARHLISGKGVGKDIDRAVGLLTAAAAQENPDAQSRLGRMYLSGEHVEKDFSRAFELLENAAVAGNRDAYWIVLRTYGKIILMQSLGAPVPTYTDPPPEGLEMFAEETYGRNSLQMMSWLRRMSAAGSGEAANALASFYAAGVNVPKDRDRAAELYKRAIALGFEKARNGLKDLQTRD